jgi:hypothetical protein
MLFQVATEKPCATLLFQLPYAAKQSFDEIPPDMNADLQEEPGMGDRS